MINKKGATWENRNTELQEQYVMIKNALYL